SFHSCCLCRKFDPLRYSSLSWNEQPRCDRTSGEPGLQNGSTCLLSIRNQNTYGILLGQSNATPLLPSFSVADELINFLFFFFFLFIFSIRLFFLYFLFRIK